MEEKLKMLKVTFKDGTCAHFNSLNPDVVACELVEVPAPQTLFSEIDKKEPVNG